MNTKLYLSLLVLVIAQHVSAAVNPLTQAFLNQDSNKYVYILSTSNDCYGPFSPKRAEQGITISAGNVNNVYHNQTACEAAGGKITDEEAQIQVAKTVVAKALDTEQAQTERDAKLVSMVVDVMQKNQVEKEKAGMEAEIKLKVAAEKEETKKIDKKFYGISFGLGLAFTHLGEPLVSDISIGKLTEADDAQNQIFVNHQAKNRAIAMLESHYFFEKPIMNDSRAWGHGPFIAIGFAGEDENIEPLSTYGGGWMWGIKRDDGTSFNMGFGIFVDTKATLLRPEYKDATITEISNADLLTYKRDKTGWMLMFSTSF